jgi:hypothetical protein
MMKRVVLASIAVAGLAAVATIGSGVATPAAAQVTITFGAPPPPLRYEVVPAPRAGYVWAPGYWRLAHNQYVWAPGRWVVTRPGYRYVPETWERVVVRGRDQWRFVPARWDRDGDGVADRYEVRRTWDRDGDGIPDRYEVQRHSWDRDGIPDRYQVQRRSWDRDYDGIPDRYERSY